ncbi:MAG: FAD-dependent oxidoreductase [Devosiaceae bacterium]|nr:FAD-dependent oxidoreductase [Devosiaceae bacterium]
MKVFIAGAGISGLLSAFYLVRAGFEVEIHEKSARAGGLIRTVHSPFGPLENGAASLLNSPEVQNLFDELGISAAKPGSRAGARYIYRDFPRRWPLSLNQSIEFFTGVTRLAFSPDKGLQSGQSVREWGQKYFGKQASSLLIETALQGVYAGDAERMSVELVLGPMLKKTNKIKGFRRNLHKGAAMPDGGMGKLISALVAYLENAGVKINFGSEIKSADIDLSSPWIIATPITAAGKLLSGMGVDGGGELQAHEMLNLTSIHLVFENSPLPFDGVGCLFPKSAGFNSLGLLTGKTAFPNQFNRPVERWFIGGALSKNTAHLTENELVDLVLADRQVLTKDRHKPSVVHVFSNPCALPHFTNELARIRTKLSPPTNMYLLGNYTGGIGLTSIHKQCKNMPGRIKSGQ